MRIRGFVVGLGLWVSLGAFAWSQQAAQDPPVVPPVEVRPPAETETFTPSASPFADPFAEFSPNSYPALRNQDFGGLNSATMSNRSIFDTPNPAVILNRNDLDERQAQDMYRALQQEVGVLMQRTAAGQSSPFIRGLTGQQILVLVDGVRMNNATYRAGPNQYFNLIDPGQVERIEVVRGAGSVLYGSDAIGGVINVVTRSASRNRGMYGQGQFIEYFSTADSGSYTRTNLEGWTGRTGVFAGASYLNVNDLDIGGSGNGRQPFTNFDQYAGDVKVDRLMADNLLMTVALQHFEQDNLPRSDRFEPFISTPNTAGTNPPSRPTFFDVQQRDLAYIRFQGTEVNGLVDAFSITGSFSRNKEASTERRGPPFSGEALRLEESEFDAWTGGLNLVFAKEFSAGVLTYGAEYYHDDIDATRVRTLGGGAGPRNPQFPDDSFYERAGAFVSADVDLTDRLSMITGVRYENAHTGGTLNQFQGTPTPFNRSFDNWASSAGLVYELSDYVNLCANFTEAFRAPNLDDIAADNGVQQVGQDTPSLNVESEHAYIYDVGMKVDAPRLRGQAFFFWNDLRDAILRQPGVVPDTFFRANFDSYIYGTELAGEYLFDGGWSTYGNFFYTFGEDRVRNEPYSRIPPTQGILGLRYRDWDHRGWIDLYTWMVDRQDRYAAQNFTDARFPAGGTPGFATLNLRLGTTLGQYDQHLVSLTLENITDKGYRVLGSGVEGTGFNAIFGWQYTR